MQDALVQHIRDRIIADVDFLVNQSLLSQMDAQAIKSKLPSGPGSIGSALQIGSEMQQLSLSSQGLAHIRAPTLGPKQQAKALWDYHQTQPDDLGFVKGDIITIEAEENPDWWRGSLNGRQGIFPSNHVERLPLSHNTAGPTLPMRTSDSPAPNLHQQDAYAGSNYNPAHAAGFTPNVTGGFVPPPPSQQPTYAYQQPQSYGVWDEKRNRSQQPQPQQQIYTPPQHQMMGAPSTTTPPPPSASAPPEIPPKNKHKFAKHMGTSFAGGLGFGTGTAIASNAINAIF